MQRPSLPSVRDRAWVRTPVDAFILARLEQKGLRPAPPADRRTLLRRVYLDLIGLPPTPAEQRAFLADPSPNAFARVVDDLLARPQYGERWGRHWLDVARYADTNGYERDGAKPSAWRYRDYVIDAFNRDKPYDRFITEQLAGDELPDASAETEIATTFLRLGTWDNEPAEPKMDRYDQLDDVLGTTAAAFLGITLRCARCHDHKFDPFKQTDYYRVLAVFEPLRRPQHGRADLDRPVGTAAQLAAYREGTARADAEVASLRRQLKSLQTAIRNHLAQGVRDQVAALQKAAAPGGGKGTGKAAETPAAKKAREQLEAALRSAATPTERQRWDRLEQQLAAADAARPPEPPHAYIWYEDGPKAPVTHVLHRGDPERPRKAVEPGVPAVLTREQPPPPRPLAHSTGRRLWLARWMTRTDNPLTARVMVNRVWQHHFGRGLVATPNDFGRMGDPPTHPELLDWLASEFMARGWSVKELHRLILLSSTYQMASAAPPGVAHSDPHDNLLERWPARRLEAEAVRDSVLAVSGGLDLQMGGPGVYPPLPRAVLEGQSRPGDGWGKSDEHQAARRSVYIFVKRSLAVPELEVLDGPDTTSSCEARPVSTIAPQALTFLNGAFINEQAHRFAGRLRREAGADARTQVERAFGLALCRPPRPEELRD
ncbi:MAG TPA: DUF1549 and DUF1553 domain-containing protein, partial [Gemmataceae bacterium]|nr:DUF1549 and DUF1553 domain-containing protein [Gemmataceae bacterium]